ncbi:MAG: DUF1883 domain-containing protein [Polaromonas sp.]
MKFTPYDLKQLKQGQAVEITLKGNAANVLLLDSINFSNYKNGRQYKYFGGHMTTSINKLPIPSSGHWHVVIDLGVYAGSVESSVRVLSA